MADDSNTMTWTHRDRLLDLLLHELGQTREDDRYEGGQVPVLITAAVTLIGAMAALFATTYPDGYPSPDSRLLAVPIWVYVAAPMLPIVLISYGALIGTLGTLRSYYMRAIERRIHQLTDQLRDELIILPKNWTTG